MCGICQYGKGPVPTYLSLWSPPPHTVTREGTNDPATPSAYRLACVGHHKGALSLPIETKSPPKAEPIAQILGFVFHLLQRLSITRAFTPPNNP